MPTTPAAGYSTVTDPNAGVTHLYLGRRATAMQSITDARGTVIFSNGYRQPMTG